jgi:NADH-quinone oxidoreductase subunit L
MDSTGTDLLQTTELLRWIVLFPLFGAIINGLFNRSKNVWIAGGLASAACLAAFITALKVVSQYGLFSGTPSIVMDNWFTWFEVGRVKVPFWLEYTPLTGLMLMVITGIGFLIHVFATGYMDHEESPWRFFSYLNLFLSAMLVLVLSSGLVGVFLGWEGVGLCSYLLIGYWYKEDANAAAGMKAFLTNRVGDLGFFIALFLLFAFFGTTQISELIRFADSSQVPSWALLAALFGIFWASTGKSAQLPLYVWLPDAMAGPTPVSALIHAATMVTSGIFVTVRLWPLFAANPAVLDVILWVGMGTAWLAALIALTQRDIKKVLAYSTVSQLGFMFVALGAGSPVAAFFHVVTHAFFKALLFLGAGAVIHGMHHKQDLFEMGGLKTKMPITHITFLVGTLAIIGFPLTAGFFSKDMILAKVYERGPVAFVMLLSAAIMTAFYMLRAYTLCFWGRPRSEEAHHAHEVSWVMLAPLSVLALGSALIGWMETPDVIFGIHALERAITSSWYGVMPKALPFEHGEHMSHALEWALMLVTAAASLSVAWFSWRKYRDFQFLRSATKKPWWIELSENKFYVDEAYSLLILKPLQLLAGIVAKLSDTWVINRIVHFLRDSTRFTGQILAVAHTGNVQTYSWYLAFGAGLSLLLSWWVIR